MFSTLKLKCILTNKDKQNKAGRPEIEAARNIEY
jgi:hypothetical protein